MKKILLLSLSAALLTIGPVRGAGVTWTSPFFDSLSMVDSHGNLLDDSFGFELGTFVTGFTPTALNFDQWASNWKLLERADFGNGKWVPNDPTFGSYFTGDFSFSATGQVNSFPGSATFTTGEQAYIWVRGGNDEWALVTDTVPGSGPDDIWQLPNPANITDFNLQWDISNASTAIIGSVNNGTFRLQTSVIPEPSTSLLVLMLGCLLQFTRHKRRLMKA